jgi:lipopolysaccharide/colanic/teichoic acid biosynthesis glycosyltransferase
VCAASPEIRESTVGQRASFVIVVKLVGDNRVRAFTKVLFDRLGAAVALVVLSPIIGATAVSIRLSMGAPVVFHQVRAGHDGVPFTILKFRTMEMRAASCCGRPETCRGIQMAPGATIPRFARFVRRTGLDELPQLINVLRGEMSFIGPRPLMVRYCARYTAEQRRRHSVLPGISGWAQVNGRTDLSWTDRLALDVWYVDHQSLWLDLRILGRTFRAAAEGSGYSQSGSDTGPEFLGTGLPPGICPVTELPLAPIAVSAAGKSVGGIDAPVA